MNFKQDLEVTQSIGGPYFIHLLFEEKPEFPSRQEVFQVLQHTMEYVNTVGDKDVYMYALEDYQVTYEDGVKAPMLVMMTESEYKDKPEIDEMARSQFYSVVDGNEKLNACKYQVILNDMMAEGLPYKERANALMDMLDSLLPLFPTCRLVYYSASKNLQTYEDALNNPYTGATRIIWGGCHARFFNIEGSEDCIVDTVGLGAFGIPDMQYHFKNTVDPNNVVQHAYNMAIYQFENEMPIKDNDTINGFEDEHWICQYENSLIQPKRIVLDVFMKELGAGNR